MQEVQLATHLWLTSRSVPLHNPCKEKTKRDMTCTILKGIEAWLFSVFVAEMNRHPSEIEQRVLQNTLQFQFSSCLLWVCNAGTLMKRYSHIKRCQTMLSNVCSSAEAWSRWDSFSELFLAGIDDCCVHFLCGYCASHQELRRQFWGA